MKKKELLIISNNVLSNTKNNGKTILSYIEDIDKSIIHQLYFSSEEPEIEGFDYFKIADRDIIVGKFNSRRRGDKKVPKTSNIKQNIGSVKIPKNAFTRIVRELLWLNSWNSKQLNKWLDAIQPEIIFFVAGDSGYAYSICEYIVNKYQARLVVYVTDDYVLPRTRESFMAEWRRNYIKKRMSKCVQRADVFFTISEPMQVEYRSLFGVNSECIVNMSQSLKSDDLVLRANVDTQEIILVYTGSFYYGRENVLVYIGEAIRKYNEVAKQRKVCLDIYSNMPPSRKVKMNFDKTGTCEYKGSLNRDELEQKLNAADILVFVESFNIEEIEKTRLSLSTKIPEYLSLGKPIFAVGPVEVASMKYLEDVAICANSVEEIYDKLVMLLSSETIQKTYARRAEEKYHKCHNYKIIKKKIIDKIFTE